MYSMGNQAFVGRRGVRYLGQYKPIAAYELADGLVLIPADSGMFPYGPGSSQVSLNVSYLVSADERSDASLTQAFREWLVFDAFILDDYFPIFYFDENEMGGVESVPNKISSASKTPDYKQIDYSNIGNITLRVYEAEERLPALSYAHLFDRYRALPLEAKDMIEWLMSGPFRSNTRPGAFFNPNYWQLLHLTILAERLIGRAPPCSASFGTCPACGFSSTAHPSVRRKDWLRQALGDRIDDPLVAEEYARLIETGVRVRNKIAHGPLFDRSDSPALPFSQIEVYEAERGIDEYEHDSVALASLLVSLRDVTRFILLDRAFNTRFFPKPRPLKVVRIGGGAS
jgi:hypothetical protein